MTDDALKVSGALVIRRNGYVIREAQNVVTAVGKAHIADQLARVPAQRGVQHMGIGTGTPTTTALGAQTSRKYLTTKTASSNIVTYVAHWDVDDQLSGSFTEAGLFTSPNAGVNDAMLCSGRFAAIAKGVNDSLDITWTLTIT